MASTSAEFERELPETYEMKQKKICSSTCLIPLKIFFNSENQNIQAIIDKLNGELDFNVQQECVRSFAAYIEEPIRGEDKELVLKLVAFLYFSCVPKHPIKKTLFRILLTVRNINLLAKHFSECIKLQINYVGSQEEPAKKVMFQDYFINSIGNSLDLFAAIKAMAENINLAFNFTFSFLSEVVDCLWERKAPAVVSIIQQQKSYIYNSTKFLLGLLQKCKVATVSEADRLRLITCCYDIISHKHVAYDIKSNCGHMMALLFTCLPDDIRHVCTFRDYPYLEFLKFGNKQPSPALEKLGLKDIEDSVLFETFKVCLYVGILIVAPQDVIRDLKLDNKLILPSMFIELVESAKQAKADPTQVMVISKAISILSSHLYSLPVEEVTPLVTLSLDFAVVYLEDKIEIVKNNTKTVFENFIKLAIKHLTEGNHTLMNTILHWLRNLPECGTRYTALTLVCSQLGCGFLMKDVPHLAKQLLNEMSQPSKTSTVYSCYDNLMQLHLKEVTYIEDWVKYWVDEIVVALNKSEQPLSIYFQRLFVSAFNSEPIALKALMKEPYLNSDNELGALLGCIHLARKKGIEIPVEIMYNYQIDPNYSWRNLLEYRTLEILKTHQSDEIRVLVLAVIVDSQRTTEIFTEWEMQFLVKYLYYNINTSNPSRRQQIIAYVKQAMTRVKDSIAVVRKNMDNSNNAAVVPPEDSVGASNFSYINTYYSKFWEAMFNDVLLPGLNPDSNYGRRSACLELLIFAFDHLSRAQYHALWHKHDLNNLKYILQYDTYERNKDLTAKLLTVFTPERLGFHTKDLVQKHIDECFSLAVSIKPALTISAAYMLKACMNANDVQSVLLERLNSIANLEELYEVSKNRDTLYLVLINLVFELHNCHIVGEHNLQEAAASKPIHGFVFCIRHLLKIEHLSKKIESSRWKKIFYDILHWCFKLNNLVKTIICNQSPEGYLPEEEDSDGDITETDETARAQMVTVYGWRAAKEISLLLGDIALRLPFYDDAHPEGLIDEQQIRAIGEYFFGLLVNTKHRGAFEQASVGFSSLCCRLWRLPVANIDKLPAQWLKQIFDILLGVDEETAETCATRRSAGVPFMVQAILITEPHTGNEQFHSCMKTLIEIGGDTAKPDEQRIHCLNILRTLFRNNQLNELVIPYCSHGMMIAIKGFASNIWGVRNSATLLFSTLLVRIFGVPRTRNTEIIDIKNKMIAQVFFARYPELYAFLLIELKKAAHRNDYPTLFPVLIVLSRLYRSTESSNSFKLETYLSSIQSCLCNPVFRIRDLAAKTSANLLQPHEVSKYIISCCLSLSDVTISNSYCHGILLQLQYLLQIPQQKCSLNVAKILDSTAWILACCNQQISHLTCTLYLEIITDLIRRYDPTLENCDIFKKISIILQWQIETGNNIEIFPPAMRKYHIHMFNIKIYLLYHIVLCHNDYQSFGKIAGYQQLIQADINNHIDLRNMCISYVHYLKFNHRPYVHHNLFEEDDSQYAELIKNHLKPFNMICKRFLYQVLYGVLEKTTRVAEHNGIMIYNNIEASILQLFSVQCFPKYAKDKRLLPILFAHFCNNYDDEVACTMIAYMDKFLKELEESEILKLELNGVFDTILKFCSPSANVAYRLGMCRLLVSNKTLFYQRQNHLLCWSNLCMIWEAVFLLLEDDDEVVRNTICQLCQEDLKLEENDYTFIPEKRVDIPEYAREIILNTMVETMPTRCNLNLLLSWIFRGKAVTTGNISEVFDEGELNTYAELYTSAKAATKALHDMLWTLEDGLNFEDKSIFIEEQCLIVATILYDKFIRNVVPLITDRMNTALKNVLVRAILFLERVIVDKPDFKDNFKKVVTDALDSKVIKALDMSELIRLKMFLGKMFKLVLWNEQ